MKKFLNDPNDFVAEMLEGVHLANPGKFKLVPELPVIRDYIDRVLARPAMIRAREMDTAMAAAQEQG